ncbi:MULTISPECIES: c-type cytochrome [unclassified Pseudomonas]|uniref:c-type cytochrome n=1 Tax=unclassified Pseudomonas TaxID=196821 RepID=UPI001913F486|nr:MULTISPECIES: cytochrome c family protein [unclassified Pseudomonas]MBK5554198.1 cytochrome c family protein [Pseudomonas sp. TH03]MEB0224376.1 cytochrome c family protein [Pseudomonas sp. 5S1]MEB0293190.1 cytochrome c family protein [Pseudomonas sp. 10S4]WPX17891.1 cytochrome c family protein [Pseudomonas sp. 10S4]
MKQAAVLTFALLLTSGLLSTQAVAAGDAEAGGKLFSKTCGGCHQVGESARGGFGPQLNGIIGRTAGSTTDYQYSDAMKNSGVVWTREKLAAYIENPKGVVSGTRMIFWGISDPEKIENLLAYLQTFQPQ